MGGIPAAVKRQERQALELHAKTYGGSGQDTGEDPAPANQENDNEGKQAPVQPQADAGSQPGQEGSEGRETDTPSKQPDYEQQYRALKGKYDAEVPRLSRDLRDAREREQRATQELSDLRKEVNELRQKGEQANAGAEQRKPAISDELRTQYAREYGDEFMDVVTAVAQDILEQRMQPLESRIDETRREVSEVGRAMNQREFFRELQQLVPDWEAINQEQDWLRWLAEYDPMAGKTRQDALDEAYANLDYVRMAALFDAYKGTRSAKAGDRSPKTSQSPSVEGQIEPGKRSGSAEPTQTPRYSMDDWTQLQEDARKGKYVGREDEFRRKESEIHAALFSKT